MITATKTLYLYVETPLHVGAGPGLSSVDLPIQRERTTRYPMIQSSGIKGKLRAVAEDVLSEEQVTILFGPRRSGADHAGALIMGDARLLLFPVRSLSGVFAYTTSYDVLERFRRDQERGGATLDWGGSSSAMTDLTQPPTALVTTFSQVNARGTVVLEESSFRAQADKRVDEIAMWIAEHALPATHNYWRAKIRRSLVILPDDDFRDFALYATEIITRIRVARETKTVEEGALWTEEHLPIDTLFYAPIYATDSRKARGKEEKVITAADILQVAITLEESQGGYIQLGGDETIGRGIVRIHWEGNDTSQHD